MPLLSVIIPFCDDLGRVEACLRSIRNSHFQDYEIVLADDGSSEFGRAGALAASYGARLVRFPSNSGPAAARNRAAREITGSILVFFDADEAVHDDALVRIAKAFESDPALDAIIGSYDTRPEVTGLVASFRNLLHACVHHRSAGEISTFWAGCGAVRRVRFEALHGFDETFQRPSVEDVDFGFRLHSAGFKIRLDPSIQITHHKEWTLSTMISADIFRRAMPWTELMMRHGLPRNLNFRWRDRVSVVLTAMLPLLVISRFLWHGAGWLPLTLALLAVEVLQWQVCCFLARHRSPWFAAACFPLLLLHYWCAAAGFGLGLLRLANIREGWFPWASPLFAHTGIRRPAPESQSE